MYIAPDSRRIHFRLERTFKKNDPILWYEEKLMIFQNFVRQKTILSAHNRLVISYQKRSSSSRRRRRRRRKGEGEEEEN